MNDAHYLGCGDKIAKPNNNGGSGLERIAFDPDEVLDRAIRLWVRQEGAPFPSRSASEVNLETNEVYLENVTGRLATYKILPDGRLRRKRPLKDIGR